jgi:hypothetical protein
MPAFTPVRFASRLSLQRIWIDIRFVILGLGLLVEEIAAFLEVRAFVRAQVGAAAYLHE